MEREASPSSSSTFAVSRGRCVGWIGVGAATEEIVHQLLAVARDPQVVPEPALGERLDGHLEIFLVVVGEQDHDRGPRIHCVSPWRPFDCDSGSVTVNVAPSPARPSR
jgi:hypothetical protein